MAISLANSVPVSTAPVTGSEVARACGRLKVGKHNTDAGLSTNHVCQWWVVYTCSICSG